MQELVEGVCIVELGETGDVFAVQRRERRERGGGSALMAYGQDVAIGGMALETELHGVMHGVLISRQTQGFGKQGQVF